jgi:hypothetical protein
MKRTIILIGILMGYCWGGIAQNAIVIKSPKHLHSETHLYDENNNFLLSLPLTFNLTDKNILVIMVGNDTILNYNQTVWFFSKEICLADLKKKNSTVSATKTFLNQNNELNTVLLPHRKISLFRTFDDNYEVIKRNAKPLLLEINDPTATQITFYPQFYVAKPDAKFPYLLFAKCKVIEIELITK